MAVGVFSQSGCLYSTMGITKSFRLEMSDTVQAESCMRDSGFSQLATDKWIGAFKKANGVMKGSSVELQKYIANVISNMDPGNKGLFFRPNGLMRGIMKKVFQHQMHTGSNIDARNFTQMIEEGTCAVSMDSIDRPLAIKQYSDRIVLPDGLKLHIPFWELPSLFPHPDSLLNPHLPLVYIPIAAFQ
jgi:hypothetical protein